MLLVLTGKEKEKEVMRKKVFAIILTLCMVLTMMPAVAWADGEDVEIWYDYGIEDGETMLPHNGRGIGNILYGKRRTAGKNEDKDFNITNVVSDRPDVVSVTQRSDGYDIDAVSLGTATITITHSGFDGQVVKNIPVEVVAEKWFCEWWAENDCTSMLPGSSLTLTAKVWYAQYDSQNDYVEDVEKPYIVKWSLGDDSQKDIITLVSDGNTVTVKSSSNIKGSVYVPVNVDVYCVDDNEAKVGDPVAGATVDCWVEQEYYTLEAEGFRSNLQKGETMTLTPYVKKYYINSEGKPDVINVSGADFECTGNDNLDISVNKDENKTTVTVTRPDGGNARFGLEARFGDEMSCERWFELDWIDDGNQGEGGEEENGDEINRQRDWTLGIPSEGGYEPVAPNPIWSEVPTYFMHDNKDSYENFYVMRKDDAAQVGTGAVQPELVIEGGTFTSVPEGSCDGYWVWKINPIGDQVNKQVFDHIKLHVETKVGLQNESRATDIWVLGTNYRHSNNNYYLEGNIALSLNLPAAGEYIDPDKFFDELSWGDERNIFYTDMSRPADDDRNSFYVFHEEGTELRVDATKLYSFDFGGTSLSGNTGGAFEKILNPSGFLKLEKSGKNFWFNDPRKGAVVTYTATKVSMEKYIGYENIRLSFAAISDNDKPPVGEARMEMRNGTTIKIEGETNGVKAIRDAHNILNEALGFPPVTEDFNLKNGVTYFDKAHATFSEDGQGLVCAFDIDLKPGYVIDSITDEEGNPYKYIVKYTYYYDVFDKSGQRLSTLDEMNEVGWWEAIGSRYNEEEREACMSHQEVATSGLGTPPLDETVTSFKKLLDGKWDKITPEGIVRAPYKAKRIGAYVDYTVLFDQTESPDPHSIVFHVSRPKDFRGSKVDIHGKNNIKIDINEVINFDKTKGNDNIAQLCEDGWEIEKIYEIGAADSENSNNAIINANGLVNITISETELSGNPEDYTVVFFTEDGVPMEMPTTYVEGQGIVFTTGHFSKYAVVNKTGTADPEPTPNPGTPGGLPSTTPSGDPTQSGTTTTTDLAGSTVSKGGETTTTVDQSTADKLLDKAVANKSEEIVISAVTKNQSAAASTKSAEVTLPAETLGAIAEKTDADVVIKTNVAEVKLDNRAAEAIAHQAQAAAGTEGKAETVSIIAEKVKEEANEVRYELKVVTSSGRVISDFTGGNVSVTVNVPKSLSNKKLICVYIDENGMMHKVEGKLNADGTYTFTTGHFSQYALMPEEDADAATAEQKAAVKAIKFKLRSQLVKSKSGKKAIRITWTNPTDIKFDGVEIFRSVKKSSGYGRKPIFVSKSGKYTNTSVKSGKKYYYKVRGFVTIDGEKVYTDWSYKAYRTVK